MLIFRFALLSGVIEPLSKPEAVYCLMPSIILLTGDCSVQRLVIKKRQLGEKEKKKDFNCLF